MREFFDKLLSVMHFLVLCAHYNVHISFGLYEVRAL